MRLSIEAESQEEFERVRDDILHRVAGSRYDLDLEKSFKAKGDAPTKFEDELLDFWERKYKDMIRKLKNDISEILG